MITTVTLNASIDKAYYLANPLAAGEVQRVGRAINSAGGKGLNCARAVSTCGEKVVATGFAGGHTGKLLVELAREDGLGCDFVKIEGETRCCVNVLEPDGRSTEFLEPGPEASKVNIKAMVSKLSELAAKSDAVTLNGSAPRGCKAGVYCKLIRAVHAAGKPALLDTSGAFLLEALEAHPDFIKPNADEIRAILGAKPTTLDEVAAAAREVREKHGIQTVVVSLGGDGALMSCADGDFRGISPKIEVVNTVGSGDTMVGAFAVALARGLAPADQLRFAMACASANCLTAETGRFRMETARELMEKTKVIKL